MRFCHAGVPAVGALSFLLFCLHRGRGAYLLGGGYVLFDLLAIAAELLFWHRLLVAMFDTAAWYWSGLWGVFSALDAACLPLGIFLLRRRRGV